MRRIPGARYGQMGDRLWHLCRGGISGRDPVQEHPWGKTFGDDAAAPDCSPGTSGTWRSKSATGPMPEIAPCAW
ncbi:MAG: hypothetical protein GDA53_02110 [Rhodobacteraceae bacterium]|nr:hypothetical protein [Paracoccaceae bacterium]